MKKNSSSITKLIFVLLFMLMLVQIKSEIYSNEMQMRAEERGTDKELLVINNINIIPMTGDVVLADQTVVIKDEVIYEIKDEPVGPAPNAIIIDGAGCYLIPGLVDMHVHMSSPNDLKLFLAHGVTTVQNMWGTEGFINLFGFPNQLRYKRKVDQGKLLGPTIYTAGPILEGRGGGHPLMMKITNSDQAKKLVRSQFEQGYDFIKVYDYLNQDVYQAISEESRKLGIAVKGHVPYAVGLWEAISSGQRQIDHLTGFLDYDAVELLISEDSLTDYAIMARENRVYICPTIVFTQKRISMDEFDQMVKAHPEVGTLDFMHRFYLRQSVKSLENDLQYKGEEYRKDAFDLYKKVIVHLRQEEVQLLAGTDTGNPFVFPGIALHDELELLVQAGMSPYEALACATITPFKSLDKIDECGTIEVGKRADLVILGKNPLEKIENTREIESVFLKGQLLDPKVLYLK